jgi:methylenetetrahydrofolate dehydrogenase (NADP+)/methenyltetrahydrofolate cyclohydrolase
MPVVLDGKTLAQKIRNRVGREVADLKAGGVVPRLQVALVGEFAPSVVYVRNKENDCAEVGIATETARLPETTSQSELLERITAWNQDPAVHGILVQLPLPKAIDPQAILAALAPHKDVDGLSPVNLGRILSGKPCFYPCTPSAVLEILEAYGIMVSGKHVVVVGRGELVGKPLANMLLRKCSQGNATVTVCHSQTPDIGEFTRQGDIVVAAVGRPGLIRADMVRPGAVVIDVGINRVETDARTRLVGDVDYAGVAAVASAITPVPGGVGPMTRAVLLENTVKAAKMTVM